MKSHSRYILTAADESYFRSFLQLYHSYRQTGEAARSGLIFYNLGLNSEQEAYLRQQIMREDDSVIYHRFPFEEYPEFVRLRYRTYSWKPLIIHTVYRRYDADLLWLDSANIILKPLDPVWKEIAETGTYVPYSGSGTLREWTVQQTLDYLQVPVEWYARRNRAGNTCGFGQNKEEVGELLAQWKDLALVRECIKPEGADRSNHRDDQSLLTILLLRAETEGRLELTEDEVDISSGAPNRFISVRNYLSNTVPKGLNFATIRYFKMRREVDILLNRMIHKQ